MKACRRSGWLKDWRACLWKGKPAGGQAGHPHGESAMLPMQADALPAGLRTDLLACGWACGPAGVQGPSQRPGGLAGVPAVRLVGWPSELRAGRRAGGPASRLAGWWAARGGLCLCGTQAPLMLLRARGLDQAIFLGSGGHYGNSRGVWRWDNVGFMRS